MADTITLTVSKKDMPEKTYTFSGPVSLIVGRQKDCGIVLPDNKVSRHHCILDINPPFVSVRDSGSKNGTYLNGRLIAAQHDMHDKDRLGIGKEWVLTLSSPLARAAGANEIAGYRKIELLGTGGVGQVWRAEEVATGRQFALKLLSIQVQPDAAEQARFLREARLAGQLSHRGIVRQYASGQAPGMFYIVQEICPGGSVGDWVKARGHRPLLLKTATHIILQVLGALHYAHHAPVNRRDGEEKRLGIVHRDIKPQNILLMDRTDVPVAKIGDFGLSKIYEMSGWTDPTGPDEFAASPEFASKEQILYYKYAKPRVDVWSAAAVYYYMLTGQPPKDMSQVSYVDRWRISLVNNAVPIRERNPAVPPKLAKVIDNALREEPVMGCAGAALLKAEIEAAL